LFLLSLFFYTLLISRASCSSHFRSHFTPEKRLWEQRASKEEQQRKRAEKRVSLFAHQPRPSPRFEKEKTEEEEEEEEETTKQRGKIGKGRMIVNKVTEVMMLFSSSFFLLITEESGEGSKYKVKKKHFFFFFVR